MMDERERLQSEDGDRRLPEFRRFELTDDLTATDNNNARVRRWSRTTDDIALSSPFIVHPGTDGMTGQDGDQGLAFYHRDARRWEAVTIPQSMPAVIIPPATEGDLVVEPQTGTTWFSGKLATWDNMTEDLIAGETEVWVQCVNCPSIEFVEANRRGFAKLVGNKTITVGEEEVERPAYLFETSPKQVDRAQLTAQLDFRDTATAKIVRVVSGVETDTGVVIDVIDGFLESAVNFLPSGAYVSIMRVGCEWMVVGSDKCQQSTEE